MKLLIVEARFYQDIADLLLSGAQNALDEAKITYDIIQVPGALEIPTAIALAHHQRPHLYQGYIALGAVIRGETSHYDVVSEQSASGLQQLGLMHRLCIGNGILTCDNEAQAVTRADPKQKNKGASAAYAAISLALFARSLQDEVRS